MEILFENNHVRNEKILKEIYQYYYFKRPLVITLDIIFGLCFLINIISWLFVRNGYYYIFALAPLFFLYQYYMYRKSVTSILKRDGEIHEEKPIEVHTIVTKDNIQVTSSTGAVNVISYSKIKSAKQTKNLILLFSEANLIIIFCKDAFTKGTSEELISFLNSKHIKVK